MDFDEKTDQFKGQADIVKDANGNEVYAEATITLYEAELRRFHGSNTEDELVATFGHESVHDLDPAQIQATKTKTGSNAIYHPQNPDSSWVKGSPDWVADQIVREIRDARVLRSVRCIHGNCDQGP